MNSGSSGNVPRLLEHADGARRAAAAKRGATDPANADPHVTSFIRLSLDDTPAARVLQSAAAQLAVNWPTEVAATTVLYEAMTLTAAGNLVGMVSTHLPRPGTPPARALEVTRLYGLLAGEALARSLGRRTAAYLDGQHGAGRTQPDSSSTLPRTAVLDLTDTIVRALLSAGLSLAGAQSLLGDGTASDRVAEALDELDQALGGIRSAVLDLHG